MQQHRQRRADRASERARGGPRAQVACVQCKEKKLRCDHQVPSCSNCQRTGTPCLVEDPNTKRHQPRNYPEILERRVAELEEELQRAHARVAVATSSTPGNAADASPGEPPRSVDLASTAATLCVNATGAEPEPTYLGPSSAFSFSRLLNGSFLQVSSSISQHGAQLVTEEALAPCPLPERATGIALSNAYFRSVHLQYPFLHEPTFRAWEENLQGSSRRDADNADPLHVFMVNMVYAVGGLLTMHSGSLLPSRLYATAIQHLDHVMALKSHESIQAILCCTMYSLRSPTGPSIWSLSGLALRRCIDFGYHRSTLHIRGRTSPLRVELRKRIFWCVWSIDCVCALLLGRPLSLSLSSIDAEFPLDINDSDITDHSICNPPRTSPVAPATTITTSLHVFRLRQIWSRIHTSFYSDVSASPLPYETNRVQIEALHSELTEWLASAPSPPPVSPFASFPSQDWYRITYSETILLLYRGHLSGAQGTPEGVFFECLHAAEEITQLTRELYVVKGANYTWSSLHSLFMCGLIYIHCLWTCPAVQETLRYDDITHMFMRCTMLLAIVAERWKAAAPYRDIFETLSTRAMQLLMDRTSGERAAASRIPMTPHSYNQDIPDITQWHDDIANMALSESFDGMLSALMDDMYPQDPSLLPFGGYPGQ